LHQLPFSRKPVADLAEINAWMAARQKRRFKGMFPGEPSKPDSNPVAKPLAPAGKNI
jgi:hypothetical protein